MMLAAAATHNDVSSTVYFAVWWRPNYFCALEMSPLRLSVVVHILRVSPGQQVFLFLNADSAGSISGCPQYRTHAINLWPQAILKSLSPSLRAGANPFCVYHTTGATAGWPLCSFVGTSRYATYRYNLLYDVPSFVSPAKGIQEALALGKLRSQAIYVAQGSLVLWIIALLLANVMILQYIRISKGLMRQSMLTSWAAGVTRSGW